MSDSPAPGFELLLQGHDTIECAYYLQAGRGQGLDFERLTIEQEALRQSKSKDPKPVALGGAEFLLHRYGSSSALPIVLENADMTIQCGEYNSPSFFVTYRSEALWRNSGQGLHQRFLDWASDSIAWLSVGTGINAHHRRGTEEGSEPLARE